MIAPLHIWITEYDAEYSMYSFFSRSHCFSLSLCSCDVQRLCAKPRTGIISSHWSHHGPSSHTPDVLRTYRQIVDITKTWTKAEWNWSESFEFAASIQTALNELLYESSCRTSHPLHYLVATSQVAASWTLLPMEHRFCAGPIHHSGWYLHCHAACAFSFVRARSGERCELHSSDQTHSGSSEWFPSDSLSQRLVRRIQARNEILVL